MEAWSAWGCFCLSLLLTWPTAILELPSRGLGVRGFHPVYILGSRATIGRFSHRRKSISCQAFSLLMVGKYRNVGFLRYWTIPNIPLFLLAIPMLIIMCQSSVWALKKGFTDCNASSDDLARKISRMILFRLAVPQGLLAVMALVAYHVQIINRICSGYPLWYWYLASLATDPSVQRNRAFTACVYAAVAYTLIQGVLFGSFLPPA